MQALDDLHERCLQLGWRSVAQDLDSILEQASNESITYAEFLSTILQHEEDFRKEASWSRRVKNARFPFVKTLSEFNFTVQTSVNKKRIQDLISRSFYRDGHNILLLGPPGVGKTHLAIAIALEIIEQGQTALFIRSDDFIEAAKEAAGHNQIKKFLRQYSRPTVLIMDEIGYAPFDSISAQIFFQVVSKRYEEGSLIITSNKSYSEWGDMLGSSVLATAILDRLLHHSSVFNIRGDSYRLKEKVRAGIIPTKDGSEESHE